MGQGNERGALEVYAGVAQTAPERIEPWVKMASVHASAKRYEEALPFYEKALLVDKNNFETRVGLAICKEGVGDFLAAEGHYKKAIELGATCAGEPGQRFDFFYGGYVYDLDGNKLCFFHMS